MSRLPNPGSDDGTWGNILNDFLAQIHKTDGSLKDDVVTTSAIAPNAVDAVAIADGSITEVLLAPAVQTKLNAVGGTPDWSTITNKPAVIAAGADQATARAAIGAGTASTKSDVGLGNVDNTSDANKNAAIATLTNKTISGASNTITNIAQSSVTNLTTDIAGKEPVITGGLTSQYWRGDKTWQTLDKSAVSLGNVNNTSDLNKPISTAAQAALDAKADLVGGVVPTAQLPSLAFNTAVTVASQVAMLALTSGQVQPGDLAIRSDGAGTFILTGADPSNLSNWTLLDSPTAPVTSVNSQTGNVVLGKGDIGLGNVDNTSDLNKPISTATQTALDAKADLVGGYISTSQLPPLSLNTAVTVASQAAMLALSTAQVQPGDLAIRTDGAGTFILTATDPSVLSNWKLLNSPTDVVTSVNSQTGAVVLSKTDVGLGNVDNTSDATKDAATATLTNKTLTNPKIATIMDANGNTILDLPPQASAVNHIYFGNHSTGNSPVFGVDGSDTNINLVLQSKGTGVLYVLRTNGHSTVQAGGGYNGGNVNLELNSQGTGTVRANGVDVLTTSGTQTVTNKTLTSPRINAVLDPTYGVNSMVFSAASASAVNYIVANSNNSGSGAQLIASGSDTNISLELIGKGTGVVKANGNAVISSVTAISAVTGTPSSSNYLRGDGTWSAISAGDASTNTSSSVDSEVVLFSGTGGKTLKRATGSGVATLTSGVLGTVTAPSGTIVGTSDTQTLTSKTLTNPTINNYTEGVVAIGTVSTTCTLDLTNGTVQTATLTASTACTFTMPTAVAGKSFVLLLNQAAVTGNGTATFTSVKWNGAGAPTITATAGKMDILSFFSNGTSWYGSYTQGYTA